jgi:hypothetical protein
MPDFFILFNHHLTTEQRQMARDELGAEAIQLPPLKVSRVWANIPPDAPSLQALLQPVCQWLDAAARPGDFVLVQGDFGACFLVAAHCLARGMVPVYATTYRQAFEQPQDDGAIRLTHNFKHVRFRRYGA